MTETGTSVAERKSVGPASVYLGIMLGSFCGVWLLLIGVLYGAQLAGILPPVPLTASISFNEKAMFVRKALHSRYDIVAAGSSLTLNNLMAGVLADEMPDHPRVLNIGAWSMKIRDTRRWLGDVLPYARPKSVILVTGIVDFYPQESWWLNVSDKEIGTFLSDSRYSQLLEFVRTFSLQYYAGSWREIRANRRSRANYDSLAFDRTGSVPLELYYPNVDLARWDAFLRTDMPSEEQYAQLGLLAKELGGHGIDLIAVQAPVRRRTLIAGQIALDRHGRRVANIIDQSGQKFIDLHALDFDDSFFADYEHLNAKGALAFTRELGHRLALASAYP